MEKRWPRRGRLLSLSAVCHFESACPFFDARKREGEGQKDGGKGQESGYREKVGKAGMSGTVSHCLTLVCCPFIDARNDQRETEREREVEGKEKRDK